MSDAAASDAFGGDKEADRRSIDSYCASSDCSMFLYNFRSARAALVVYRSQPPTMLQSAVSKVRELVMSSNSGMGRYYTQPVQVSRERQGHRRCDAMRPRASNRTFIVAGWWWSSRRVQIRRDVMSDKRDPIRGVFHGRCASSRGQQRSPSVIVQGLSELRKEVHRDSAARREVKPSS